MESPEQDDHLLYISGGDEDADEAEVELETDLSVEKSNSYAAVVSKNYTILSEADIVRRQGDAMDTVCSVLSVSKTAACLLLHRYNWNANVVSENWFSAEESVRKAVGLLPENSSRSIQLTRSSSSFDEVLCQICFENFSPDKFYSAACGHQFCGTCWKSYINTAINDGPGCLTLRCPDISCGGAAAVGLDMIGLLASREDRKRYNRFLLRSYVEDNRNCKWCPSPGCAFAVEFNSGDDDGGDFNVTCNCSHSFCWNCTEESHRPVDCETLEHWKTKNDTESNNTQWILAYTKPCPKCKRPIEKNQGCNRITCRPPCQFQFCWLCLNDWSVHGYNACNSYMESKTTQEMQMNRKHLSKYTHYYERWASNHKSKQQALSDLREMQNKLLDELSELQCEPKLMFDCVVEAWKQIIECRSILKWSYVYGYYLSEEEEGSNIKLQLFEYLQGQAESGLERLHHCVERELNQYIYSGCGSDFRGKLKRLTRVTGNYFENLVRALKNGLSEVDSNGDQHTRKRLRTGEDDGRVA